LAKSPKPENPPTENADVIARAYRKIMAGKPDDLTNEERTAVKRHEKAKEERLRWQYYASIPQKHWRQMSGRQAKILNEQAVRYGIPFDGATVSLPAVIRALHDFLADNKHKLARDDDVLMVGPTSPALERYREERAAMARMSRLEREGELLPRDSVRQSLSKTATILRNAGESLQKQFGQSAADLLYEAIGDAEAEIIRFFTQRDSEDDNGVNAAK
jgi:hypothetical protein